MTLLPWLVSVWLFAIGLYGILTSRHYVHLIACLSVTQSGTYVLLLAAGFRWQAGPPVFHDHPPGTPAVDPVVQALVLTDIVVGAAKCPGSTIRRPAPSRAQPAGACSSCPEAFRAGRDRPCG
ncbi:sodium:proton antiporter [Roseomonas mucosa]|uniref:sodium:proton antiporter n=1 Tax=Roseomonas mucosa TaxID=207340 RepID=UPI00209A9DBB|nr:sodium:proton antiporter [Roseomonas mucosa]